MADPLRPPRDPRVLGSRRLCRPGHASAAPCCGAAPSACRRGSGRRAVPGPGRGAGQRALLRRRRPRRCRSRPEPVRGRGSHCPCCRVHLDCTSGRVPDGERSTRRRRRRLRPSRVGRVPAEHGRATAGAEAGQRPAGQWPERGLGTRGGSGLAGGSRCLVQGRGAVGRLRAHRRGRSDGHRHGRVARRDRPPVRVRTSQASVVRPARRGRERVARRAWWQGRCVREASGLGSGGVRAGGRERASGQARSRGWCVRGRARGERRLVRRFPPDDRVDRCGPRPSGRIDRGRSVAAGAPP